MATRQNLTMIFDKNVIFTKQIFDTILYKVSVHGYGLYQNSNAKSTKVTKMEVANTQLSVCFEAVFCVS